MKYLLLLAGDEVGEDALSDAERQRIVEEHGKFAGRLSADGAYVLGAQLDRSSNATTLAGGVLTDGPFAEGREQIGGIYVIEAPDLDKALDYARQIPPSPGLRVEVRPLLEM
ncbi:MAG TPA: YciI family protein [Jatrophihabitantaceae bacterium]|nr:YciI family protein [Jatrophihabitantaceae bacterium]